MEDDRGSGERRGKREWGGRGEERGNRELSRAILKKVKKNDYHASTSNVDTAMSMY